MDHRGNLPEPVGPTAGMSSAVADMYESKVTEVYRFIYRRCRDHAMAEDITQETFLKAVRQAGALDGVSDGWLFAVARNRLIDVIRQQDRRRKKLRFLSNPHPAGHETEVADRMWIEEALNGMSVDHRLVLTLHYLDGLTVPALAEQMNRSVKSVEGLITRARRELRGRLDDAPAPSGNPKRMGGTS